MSDLNKILLVEDEPDIQKIVGMALEMVGGFSVTVCSSGAQALREIDSINPDLVLLDVMMPEMDGPTTLRELRKKKQFATLPIVFLTAKVQPQEIAGYRELGALGVIQKPFDPMALSDQVRSFWQAGR